MTNKQLKRIYRRYNKKFFDNKLPDISVRFANTHKHILGDTVFLGNDPSYILIARDIRNWDRLVRQVLLHEQVHVSLPVKIMHGPRFEARMRRLARQNAFQGLW